MRTAAAGLIRTGLLAKEELWIQYGRVAPNSQSRIDVASLRRILIFCRSSVSIRLEPGAEGSSPGASGYTTAPGHEDLDDPILVDGFFDGTPSPVSPAGGPIHSPGPEVVLQGRGGSGRIGEVIVLRLRCGGPRRLCR